MNKSGEMVKSDAGNQRVLSRQSVNWANTVAKDTQGLIRGGLLILGFFLVAFGLWATLFPLSSAVIAMGIIVPVGNSKAVQHPVGGTVIEIHAVDGETVALGDPIFTLDPIIDQSELDQLTARKALLQGIEARLVAQLEGSENIVFPPEFYSSEAQGQQISGRANDFRYAQIINDQKNEFVENSQFLEREISEIDRRIQSSKGQLASLSNQRSNIVRQRRSLRDTLKRVRPLLEKGFYTQTRADELELEYLRVSVRRDEVAAQITGLEFSIQEFEDRKAAIVASSRADANNELSRTRGELDTIDSQLIAVGSTLKRLQIRAPAAGVLTKSSIYTIGGVVRSGEVIAEIVPSGGYVVEARVSPADIDYVRSEQSAEVVVTAFNRQLNDAVPAIVDYVSADSEIDDQTGEQYFITRLVLQESEEVQNQIDSLRSGMQSEVYISTGERTFLTYVMQPLTDGFRRAFRES